MAAPEPLADGVVHVWTAGPEVMTDPEAGLRILSAAERARHARFVAAASRQLFLMAHTLVRTTLSRYALVEPGAWEFTENEHGRPEIAAPADGRDIRFNMSHTEGLVACAVTRTRDVGVDVEDTRRAGKLEEIAARFFAPAEVAAFRALPAAARRARFFEYWTLKEAYMKARGLGFALPPSKFTVHLDGEIRVVEPGRDDPARTWQFALLRPTPHHMLSVCVGRGDGPDLTVTLRK